MVEHIVDMAQSQALAGVLLYSEIGEFWYSDLGFEPFSTIDFCIDLEQLRASSMTVEVQQRPKLEMIQSQHHSRRITGLESGLPQSVLEDLSRHYMRWLSRQPFGLIRNENYLAFKLGKEEFLVSHSSCNWPKKTYWLLSQSSQDGGYAITEQSGANLRILEVIGSESARRILWQSIVEYALDNQISRLRGWEAVIRDFAPAYSVKQIVGAQKGPAGTRSVMQIHCVERSWGLPMLLPLQEGLDHWWNQFPSPFMELDYL